MNIPYYIRNRVFNSVVNVFMIFFLALTLLPIGWMVYSSFKSNTEILLGSLPLGRYPNDVRAIERDGDKVWILTADGGITAVSRTTGDVIDTTSMKTMATSFTSDPKFIYIASANKGVSIIPKTYLHGAQRIAFPIDNLDVNKVVSTSIVKEGNRLWVAYQHRDFEKLFELNTEHRELSRVIHLSSSFSPFQVTALAKYKDALYVGCDKGVLKVDLVTGKMVSAWPFALLKIVATQVTTFKVNGEELIVGTDGGAFIRHLPDLKGGIDITTQKGLIDNYIGAIAVTPTHLYLGTHSALSEINRASHTLLNYEDLFARVNRKGAKLGLVPRRDDTLESGIVMAIASQPGEIYLGSSGGRVTRLDPNSGSRVPFTLARPGHLRIMWRNYIDLWKNINFGLFLRNSIIVCGITMFLAMIFSTLSAYALSRFTFPGSRTFSFSILATQMVPAIMLLIPIYTTFVKITLATGIPIKGTFWGLIAVYSAFFIPFSIWILRGFFAAIPRELEEAARIDGCSVFQVFRYISLPLAVPGIIATGIYVFLTAWDELMFAWVLTSADTMTIPVGIRNYVGNYQNRFDLMMAAATVATVPVMILFFLLQKHIVKGLTAGAVKG